MERFHDGQHVWLRSRAHGTYLNARGDGRSVSLRRRRASLKAAWTVHIHQGDVPYLLLHSAAYGRYPRRQRAPRRAAPLRRAGGAAGHHNHFMYTVLGQAWRLIEFVRANAEGLYDEDDWHMFALRGRYVNHLRNELADRIAFMDGHEPDGIAMCIRAGRYGRPTPLVVDLPRYTGGPAETHQIVVMMSGTPVYSDHAFRITGNCGGFALGSELMIMQ
ncbi:hypothetical protein D1007_06637 [Hordeum vulgare]|nr:hypothetical protein D1007_06637 [Hordeum vulgare]